MEKQIKREAIAKRSGITWKDILFYSLGDFGICFVFAVANSLLSTYYDNCLMFNPYFVIIVFLIARVWDAINDPIMGRIADKMKPNKHGKYKRWLFYMCLPLAVATVLMMLQKGPAELVENINTCWWQYIVAGLTYILYGMVLTAIQIPYGSLVNVVTADAKERSKLSIARGVAGNLGGLPVLAVKSFCIVEKGTPGAEGGFAWKPMIIGVAILGVFSAFFLFLCYKFTKERNIAKPAIKEKGSFKKAIGRITHSRSMLSICVIAVLIAGSSMFSSISSVFVSKDFFEMTGFLTILPDILNIAGIFITMFIVPFFANKFGKKEATTMGIFFCVAVYSLQMLIILTPHETATYPYYLYVTCNFLSGLGSGFFNLLLWSMVGDAVDDIYIRTGVREDGTSYSILMFSRKIGQTVAFCVGQGVLIAIGYVASKSLTADQKMLFWFLSTGIPLVCFTIGALLFIFWYPISKKRLEEIQDVKNEALKAEEKGKKLTELPFAYDISINQIKSIDKGFRQFEVNFSHLHHRYYYYVFVNNKEAKTKNEFIEIARKKFNSYVKEGKLNKYVEANIAR